jgi:nanoRNase/pAp phosphatase (c-di-AMP/oligoRNAs hydrolase)
MLNNYQQISELIKKSENILLTFPGNKNGEAVTGVLAMNLVLSKLNKKCDILTKFDEKRNSFQKPLNIFSFLPEFEKIKTDPASLQQFVISLNTSEASVKTIKYKMGNGSLKFFITPEQGSFTPDDIQAHPAPKNYDLIITLNAQDPESLEDIYENNTELFYNTPIINIDNHSGNEEFGAINLVDLTATSTTEILYSLLNNCFSEIIDEDIATCILAGIIYKTKSFKSFNITPQALQTTSDLISLGARHEEILNNLYRSRNLNALKLWGRAMARLSGTNNNKLIWSTLFHNDFIKTEAAKNELPEILDELSLSIPHAEIMAVFYEDPEDEPVSMQKEEGDGSSSYHPARVIIRSTKNINLLDLLKDYQPAGYEKLIEIKSDLPIQQAKKDIIGYLQEKIQQLPL